MGSCFWGTQTSRNCEKDKAEQKDKDGNKFDKDGKIKNASSITSADAPATNGIEIVLKTNAHLAKANKITEDQPYVYVQANDEITQKINKASSNQDNRQAIKQLEKIAALITDKNEKSLHYMEKLAFVSTSLAERYAKIDQFDKCKQQEQRALHIYSQFQSEYFEELIIILNNSALRCEQAGQYEQAIDKYMTIDKLEDKYYSINDERKLLNMNNLACLYFDDNKKTQSQQVFQKILNKTKQHKYSREITNLIKSNYQYYFKQSPQ